jgi:hypothetical protein
VGPIDVQDPQHPLPPGVGTRYVAFSLYITNVDAPIITVSSIDFHLSDNHGSIGKPRFLTFGGSGTSLDRVALDPGAGTAARVVFEVRNTADPAELTYRYAPCI